MKFPHSSTASNYSRESVSQKGLGLNPKRLILRILSSFTRFECRLLDAMIRSKKIFRRNKILVMFGRLALRV